MEAFAKLFGSRLLLVYHCFDRMVLSGYLMGLQRAGQVVYWLREVAGVEQITKAVLQKRTAEYVGWVQSYARNGKIPLQWAEKGMNKEGYVLPYLRRLERDERYGVYFIFQANEQGWTYRPGAVRKPGDYPILHKHRSRYRYFYFYVRDEVLGPIIVRMGTFIPFEASYWLNGHSWLAAELRRRGIGFRQQDNALVWAGDREAVQQAADELSGGVIRKRLDYWTFVLGPKFTKADRRAAKLERSYYLHQTEYSLNFVFRKNHPIRQLFERSCELGLWRLSGDKVMKIFGGQKRHRLNGRLQTTLERMDGHHVFRAYWKHAWVKQYEKYRTFLRNEITSNNLRDFGLRKGLEFLGEARAKLVRVLDRFTAEQAGHLNVHPEFSLLRRLALPVQNGAVRLPGIRLEDPRMIRLMEVLLHAGVAIGGWTARQIHQTVQQRFDLSEQCYRLNSLRYDLRKLKGHGLIERTEGRYCYRLTEKGQRVAVLFLLFHQRLCGPLAGSQFQNRPQPAISIPPSRLEAAYDEADKAIDQIIDVLRAA